jgi:hypothetical protein
MKKSGKLIGIVAVIGIVFLVTSALPNLATNQFRAAESLSYEKTLFSEEMWLQGAREMAVGNGLVGQPTREEAALMTYGSYLVLTGQHVNSTMLPRDSYVFVYQVFGNIPTLQGFGSAAGRTDIEGFIFAFDAHTAHNFASTALVKGKSGALDLSIIPADTGTITSLQPVTIPTAFPLDSMSPEQSRLEATSELVPLPLNVIP